MSKYTELEEKIEGLEARIAVLEGESPDAPPKEVGAKEDPDQWVYHKNDRAGKVVTAKEAKRLKGSGWVSHLHELED